MAFGPSLHFIAPQWEPTLVRTSEPKGNPVPAEPFRSWLRSLGFKQHPGPGNNFSMFPTDVFVCPVDDEVMFVTVDFGMTDDALQQIGGWQDFGEELCGKWGLSLTDGEKRVPMDQFRRIIAQDANWRLISNTQRWPPIWTPAE